jgi:hypothetical protein
MVLKSVFGKISGSLTLFDLLTSPLERDFTIDARVEGLIDWDTKDGRLT